MKSTKRTKIALVGAGNIGGTLAHKVALEHLGDIAIIDVAEGVAQGKALDLSQAGSISGYDTRITAGKDYGLMEGADAVIVTAGVPRKPGMSRDDLVEVNTKITKQVAEGIKRYASDAFVVMVTNPLDAMVWVMRHVSGLPSSKVVGMAGILDAARFTHFLSEACGVSKASIHAMVMGGHGDTMVPLARYTTIGGVPLSQWISMGVLTDKQRDDIIQRTRDGGAEIVSLLGSGSAFYAPAVAALSMVKAYLFDEKRVVPCAAWMDGSYGVKDIYAGVPVVIGAGGVEKIIEYALDEQEKAQFAHSVKAVQEITDSARKVLATLS
ncbi:MAG: malate dehydrogenase [Alphaproteobacteria bacterium GM7ARS4]|nr:malate dehydrogenase [Alphaproteobacteria bacterium GM7ARS4]